MSYLNNIFLLTKVINNKMSHLWQPIIIQSWALIPFQQMGFVQGSRISIVLKGQPLNTDSGFESSLHDSPLVWPRVVHLLTLSLSLRLLPREMGTILLISE